ncbi:hypothetical protein D9758_005247 [Tetrapyrgos nigripes]|uniref:Uncharacterized protein n=1 Tax=Tetrapyrgos nigripes TaxID=182062 RepID=A0A8H5GWV7_9AGAR|nr:hypothetical protein D9758_005247 [Tetrapyrgos nigripes]
MPSLFFWMEARECEYWLWAMVKKGHKRVVDTTKQARALGMRMRGWLCCVNGVNYLKPYGMRPERISSIGSRCSAVTGSLHGHIVSWVFVENS